MEHWQLLQLSESLGYRKTPGLCHGFTLSYNMAVLSGEKEEEEHFFDRLNFLKEYVESPGRLQKDIQAARDKVKNKTPLNDDDKILLEIPAWFDAIHLGQEPSKYKTLFSKRVEQYEVKNVIPYIQSISLANKEFEERFFQSNKLNAQELEEYLLKVSKLLNGKYPSVINFSSNQHRVAVKVVGENKFVLIDSSYLSKSNKVFNASVLARKGFYEVFRQDPIKLEPLVFNTYIYTGRDVQVDFTQLNSTTPLTSLSYKQKTSFSQEAIYRDDVASFKRVEGEINEFNLPTLLHLALRHNSKKIVEHIVKERPSAVEWDCLSHEFSDGALQKAIEKKHYQIALNIFQAYPQKYISHGGPKALKMIASQDAHSEALALVDAIIDSRCCSKKSLGQCLTAACEKGNLPLVQILLVAGATIDYRNKGHMPLEIACKLKRPDMVLTLIEHADHSKKELKSKVFNQYFDSLSGDKQKVLLEKALSAYIQKRESQERFLNIFNFGFSKQEKLHSANTLLAAIRGDKVDLAGHQAILKNGKLKNIYHLYQKGTFNKDNGPSQEFPAISPQETKSTYARLFGLSPAYVEDNTTDVAVLATESTSPTVAPERRQFQVMTPEVCDPCTSDEGYIPSPSHSSGM
jgi:hypothetical protein